MRLSCSMPDVDAEKANLEPDSISFMETLISRERGQVGLQNGYSSTSFEENRLGALSGSGAVIKTKAEDKEKTSTPSEQTCPVGLHKAVLLYPPSAQSLKHNNLAFCLSGSWSHSTESLSLSDIFIPFILSCCSFCILVKNLKTKTIH